VIEQADGGTVSVTYRYDPRGLLREDTCVLRSATGRERRFARRYTWLRQENQPWPVLLEASASDESGTPLWQRHYIRVQGQLVGIMEDGISSPALCDARSSLLSVEPDATGTLLAQGRGWTAFDSWGVPLEETGRAVGCGSLGFTGQWQDPLTGLLYLNTRFYAPELGIFLSADQAPFRLDQPLTMNRYAYCQNDPVNRLDPQGTFSMLMFDLTLAFVAFNLPMNIGVESYYLGQMLGNISFWEPEQRNVSLTVHGVSAHDKNYSRGFHTLLRETASNQDYREFLWSGFTILGIPNLTLPNLTQHTIACTSLAFTLACLRFMEYENINVLAHSWGTVLSKHALFLSGIEVGLWATMGSPLTIGREHFDWPHPRSWINIYYPDDPIIYLGMEFPGPFFGTGWPLFLSDRPDAQHIFTSKGGFSHTQYFDDIRVTRTIGSILSRQ
ncbi:MAG: RHS repeat-associated core domain-containing protein, partial [Victivallales bacterium]|nr:RHS repeat-associated core domain-containing protein [Victivallales bacterium]